MVLSIGMIVKNEEKYLRQCLTALQPLRDAVDSELIIVDTGSTDKTVEIAREFTDNVLFFEWINDFSAARNVSLKAAKGEWFMFVDADEVFQSCDDLIYFFKSGEYKEFNSALFNVRSYPDLNIRERYMDCYVPRLTKILPETEFVGVIHEHMTTFDYPKRLLTDVADHYGYVFVDNAELKEEKFERNSALLQERLKTSEKDNNPALYKELFDCYNFLDDKTQSVEYAYQGIELCKKLKTDYIFAFYHILTMQKFTSYEDEEVIKLYDEYFSVDKEIRVKERSLDIEFYAFKAMALHRLERYEEAYLEFRKYFELDEKMTKAGICTREALYVARNFTNENAIIDVNLFYAETCIKLKRYKDAEMNFRKLPLDKFNYNRGIHIMRLNQMIDYLRYTGSKALGAMYGTLSDEDKKLFIDAIRFRIFSWEEEEQRGMVNKLSAMNFSKPVYNRLTALIKTHLFDGGLRSEQIRQFIVDYGAVYPDVLYMMIAEKMDISPYVLASGNIAADIKAGFNNIVGYGDTLRSYDPSVVMDTSCIIHFVRIYMQALACGCKSGQDTASFTMYAGEYAMQYLQTFGEANVPNDVIAAVTVKEIELLFGAKRYKDCIASLRTLIQLDKEYALIAKEYQRLIKEQMEN